MTPMAEEIVGFPVSFGVAFRTLRVGALYEQRLQIGGLGISGSRIAIPGFDRKPASHLLINETTRKRYTGIEPLHRANPKDQIRSSLFHFEQMDAFLNAHAKRFFHQDVLASFNCLNRGGDMELVSDSDDHRFNLR